MIRRRKTRTISVGGVKIGSDYPVRIQSMTKTNTLDTSATIDQIRKLEDAGCEIVRIAVNSYDAAKMIPRIKAGIKIPLVGDIHFDYRLAILAIENGIDKIRINPGNIYKKEQLQEIISAASLKGIPIRIGVNSGSLPRGNKKMADSVLKFLEYFKKKKYNNIVISVKASNVIDTVEAYRKISKECDCPLHLGITAAGLPEDGIVSSSIGIGALLMDGIGDTIRVSLTGESLLEVYAARRILSSLDMRSFGPKIISCPTCGRCKVDLVPIVKEFEEKITQSAIRNTQYAKKPLTIALMGCEVNGPGEAKGVDFGIAFGKNKGAIFKHGRIVKTVETSVAVKELVKLLYAVV